MYAHDERPIVSFDSVGEWARKYREIYGAGDYGTTDTSWFNGETGADSVRLAQQGDDRLVAQAATMLDQFNLAIETTGVQRMASPFGAYPIVPEFLSGYPDCMRRNVHVEGESMPLRVVVGLTSSGAISSEQLLRRGVAILAFVMAAGKCRPVQLEVLAALSGCEMANGEDYTIVRAPIASSPLDLASACYALTSAGFQRRIGYGICDALRVGKITRPDGERYGREGSHGMWQKLRAEGKLRARHTGGDAYDRRMRELLDLSEEDVYVPEIYLYDEAVNEPLTWIRNRLKAVNLLADL
jgi:hypothetical protein